ncbi:MAG: hypothetical protein WBV82_00710 [Myxococcaceae bacterium]
MRVRSQGWLLVLLLTSSACVLQRGSEKSGSTPEPAWSDFHWEAWNGFEKAAMFVPVQWGDTTEVHWLQLDTGSARSVLYRAPTGVKGEVRIGGRIGHYRFENALFGIAGDAGEMPGSEEGPQLIGTLGLDFLKGRILLLDLPAGRFAILEGGSELPESVRGKVHFVPLELRHDKAMIQVQIGGAPLHLFYDTGASIFSAVTPMSTWQKLTGRSGHEADNAALVVPSWGRSVALVGARAAGAMAFSSVAVEEPLIFCDPAEPPFFDFSSVPPADGLLGNALFSDGYLVVLDLDGNRFGLTASSLTQAAGAGGGAERPLRDRQ